MNRKTFLTLLAALCLAALGAALGLADLAQAAVDAPQQPDAWLSPGTLPEPRGAPVVQCADEPDVFYRLGGLLSGGVETNKLDRYDIATDTWTILANMPAVRRIVAATCYQGKIYAAGGNGSSTIRDTLYIYDIAANTWSSGANTPTPVWGAGLGAWEGKLYLVGGTYVWAPWTPTDRVDVYDIATDTWTAGGGKHMPTAAMGAGVRQRGPHLYIVGGYSGDYNANVNQTQRYNMSTNTWETGPTFTSQRGLVGLGMTATHLYALGGDANGGGGFDATNLVEALDLTAWPGGAWTDISDPLPQVNIAPASACSEAKTGGEVWAIGGANGSLSVYNTLYYRPAEPCFDFYFGDLLEEDLDGFAMPGETASYTLHLLNAGVLTDTFDISVNGIWTVTAPITVGPVGPGVTVQFQVDVAVPSEAAPLDWDTAVITATSQGGPYEWDRAQLTTVANGWFDAGTLPEPRAAAVVQCPDEPDVFYRLGGILAGGVDTDQFDRYDVITDTWTTLANMPAVRRIVAATCYQGKIYAAGGYGNGAWHNTLYIYDIQSDTWSSGAHTPNAVWGAALGAWEGKLYLVGGTYYGYPYMPTARVDVYDIATNTWTLGGGMDMPTPASFPGARQRGPYLYLVGGSSGNFAANVDQTQRYDMATDTWQSGPTFTSRRALVGLGMTSTSLYALGGDANGGDAFDATDLVEVLDLSAWPGGAWVVFGDNLPQVNLAPASACSEALAGGEVWAIGGALNTSTPYNTLYYHPTEPCLHYGVDLPADSVGAGPVGQTLDYLLTITNTSVVTDYYQLEFSSIWTVNPLPAEPVMVGPGQSAQVAFGVEIPADAADGDVGLTEVTATSLSNYAESDITQFTTTALGYGLDMDPGLTDQSVALGQVVTYTLTITNDGHLADSYVVSAEGNAWEVTLPAEPVALDVDESAEALVLVTVPLSAWPGNTDAVTITVTSQGDARISQQAVLTTTALGYAMSPIPEVADQTVQPGQVVTYTLTIANAGHLADSYVVSAEGNGWEVTLPAAPIALDVGESAEVVVLVTAPLCAWPGQADVVTITVTSQGDPRVSQQAVLTTTAGGYRVVIPMVIKT